MRILPTLRVCGWLVAAAALPTLSVLEWIAGGAAQAQQFDPPDRGGQNPLQPPPLDLFHKELLFRGREGLIEPTPLASPPTSDWLNSLWLSSVTDPLNDYWAEQARNQARDREFWRSLFSVGNIQGSSPGKGDFWKGGEFESLIGPR